MNNDDKHDVNVYITFALYAVTGEMGRADQLMRDEGASVRRVAAYMARKRPFRPRPVYRGMLVDPSVPVAPDDRLTFVSWSEDRDVACWFAERDTIVNEYVKHLKPTQTRGVVLELRQPRAVLFHYSWGRDFEQYALQHPHIGGEGARQFMWSLSTQREVITGQLAFPPATDVADIEHPSVAELDQRLAPPWIERTFK